MSFIQSRMGAIPLGAVVRSDHARQPLGQRRFHRSGRRLSLVSVRASFSEEDHMSEEEPVFFYDERRTNEHLKDWRTFRALLVASERGMGGTRGLGGQDIGGDIGGTGPRSKSGIHDYLGVDHPKRDDDVQRQPETAATRWDDLRRVFRVSHVREALGKHVHADTHSIHNTASSTTQGSVWSHTITHPERGCLLVAKRPDLGMFSYSVVLLTEHDDEIGSSGLVLNMATPLRVSNLGLEDHISESLGKLPLYIGGPVTRNLLHVLHGVESVEGSMEIVPGVYAGGVESAAELVLQGALKADEFRLLAGYSGWEPYQLSEEIQHGAWHVISASSDVILGCIKGDFRGFSRAIDFSGRTSDVGGSYGLGGHDVGVDTNKLNCWKAILSETMFGE